MTERVNYFHIYIAIKYIIATSVRNLSSKHVLLFKTYSIGIVLFKTYSIGKCLLNRNKNTNRYVQDDIFGKKVDFGNSSANFLDYL